ncbi:hypothetical protein ACYX8G_08305 [Microbacterium saperdae]
MYSFRVPFEVISGAPDTSQSTLDLAHLGDVRVWIQAVAPLRDSQRLSLRASGFPTTAAATEQAEQLVSALRLTFLRSGLLADFLERTPLGALSPEGLRAAGGHLPADRLVVDETPGVMVYPTGHQILAFRGSAVGATHSPPTRLIEQFRIALGEAVSTPRAKLAYDLYSGHTRMPTADASLLTLVSAAESLIVPNRVPGAHLELIEQLVAEVTQSSLPQAERNAFADRVRTLRTESIRKAARRLASTLRPRVYCNESPELFFDRVYEIRSRLVHGDSPPSSQEVERLLPPLAALVRDLVDAEFVSPGISRGSGQPD